MITRHQTLFLLLFVTLTTLQGADGAGVIRKRDTVDRSKSGGTVGEGGAGGEGGPDEEAKITLTSQMMLDGCPYATGDM